MSKKTYSKADLDEFRAIINTKLEVARRQGASQKKFIDQLERALVRIENGTYGRCKSTGTLIPRERLRVVPHTESSLEADLG